MQVLQNILSSFVALLMLSVRKERKNQRTTQPTPISALNNLFILVLFVYFFATFFSFRILSLDCNKKNMPGPSYRSKSVRRFDETNCRITSLIEDKTSKVAEIFFFVIFQWDLLVPESSI